MRAWSTLITLVGIACWLANKLGVLPEVPESLAIDVILFTLAFGVTVTYLHWRRLRTVQTVAGFTVIILTATAFFLFHALHDAGVIPWKTYDAWFIPVFAGSVLSVLAAVILIAVDRIDHPRRWKLVAQHAAACSFLDSLLFRDIPDLTGHEEADF